MEDQVPDGIRGPLRRLRPAAFCVASCKNGVSSRVARRCPGQALRAPRRPSGPVRGRLGLQGARRFTRLAGLAARGLLVGIPAAAAHAGGPGPTRAAAQLVDSGAFRLYVDGREVGAEEYTIQRVGARDAQRTFARGTITMRDGRIFRTVLQTVGPEMSLAAYQLRLTGTDTAAVDLVRVGDRVQGTVLKPEGERVREYRARPESLVLERGVAHHHFVLGRFAGPGAASGTVHVFAPLADEPEAMAEIRAGPHTLETEAGPVATTRVQVGPDGTGGTAWFDGSGRLVRVENPLAGFVAVRLP